MAAHAQRSPRVLRVGFVGAQPRDAPTPSLSANGWRNLAIFQLKERDGARRHIAARAHRARRRGDRV